MPMGTPVRLVVRNTSDVPINVLAALKGHLETDLERADRLLGEFRKLRSELAGVRATHGLPAHELS